MKINHGPKAPEWFTTLDFPFPQNFLPVNLNWAMAGYGEVAFAALLLTPLAGWAALGLMYICFVAVYTSHFGMGLAGWDDPEEGFKIPLMYALMASTIALSQFESMKAQVTSLIKR